ncbi:lysophospholipase [Paenibacillus sp. BIHB 4019]|uniref:Lysophospholipase n=1 Tax=Paenibacillus sp. BIHB 4019 TaxID=1870819 RepID=A0A1B2DEL3_9BACL|nr:SGNH/GDSL hydrolase family protein [Paenibacillus sp. BIHB 4019]ANY66140.1 lysophospholipase [Paenibacillus sp. BIHB 4019]
MSEQQLTVLFQGDSITDGSRGRNDDLNHILGHSYPYLIASRLGYELAEKAPHFINKGISGDRVSDLYARWNEDALSLKPDVLSILIGVNDAWRTMSGEASGATDRFERAYRHLLEETAEVLPQTRFVLVEPFILKTGVTLERWDEWQQIIKGYQEKTAALAAEYNAVLVRVQHVFDKASEVTGAAYWLWDGVHPTAAGHELLAREWLSTVQNSRLAIK